MRNPFERYRGYSSEFWFMIFAGFINRFGMVIVPFMSLYFLKGAGFSVHQTATILGTAAASAIAGNLISGYLCDRYSPRLMVVTTLTASALSAFLFFGPPHFEYLLLTTCLFSFSNEAFRPAQLSYISELSNFKEPKKAFALIRFASNLGLTFGPPIAGLLILSSYRWIFFMDGFTSILAASVLIYSWKNKLTFRELIKPKSATSKKFQLRDFYVSDPLLWVFLLAMFLVFSILFQYTATLPLFISDTLKLSAAYVGAALTINTLMITIFELPLTTSTLHWSYRKSLTLGSALVGIGFAMTMLSHSFAMLAASVVVWSAGEMVVCPPLTAFVTEIATPEMRGRYMGFFGMTISASLTGGPFFGLLGLNHFGNQAYWLILGAFSFLAMGLFLVALQIRKNRLNFNAYESSVQTLS